MKKVEQDLEEIREFLADFAAQQDVLSASVGRKAFKAAYKPFHALLIWGLVAESESDRNPDVELFFRECLSDVSHALVLSLLSFYKPARVSLRSGLENLLRSVLLSEGVDAKSIGSVFELFGNVRGHFSHDPVMQSLIDKIRKIYIDLCKTVHSQKLDYMSLRVSFEKLSQFDSKEYSENLDLIRDGCSFANQVIFLIWSDRLRVAGYPNEDMVRDATPRAIKRVAGTKSKR